MSKEFPRDEFDSLTAIGGRHRAKRTLGNRLASLAGYTAAIAVLSGLGIGVLVISSGQSTFTDNLGGQGLGNNANVGPQFNSNGIGVNVIDATAQAGVATKVAQKLYDAGWNVLSASNYSMMPKWSAAVATPAPAPDALSAYTTVFYTDSAAKSAASSVLRTLGAYKLVQSASYSDPVTVIIGSDYK
ncbi:MAG: LytR C-terminal domain-containing protein [Micrococcales bacterium]